MPKIIVKTEYIKEVSHLVNYLEYAGNKLEAQVVVYQDGTRQEQAADKLLQLAGLDKPVRGLSCGQRMAVSSCLPWILTGNLSVKESQQRKRKKSSPTTTTGRK